MRASVAFPAAASASRRSSNCAIARSCDWSHSEWSFKTRPCGAWESGAMGANGVDGRQIAADRRSRRDRFYNNPLTAAAQAPVLSALRARELRFANVLGAALSGPASSVAAPPSSVVVAGIRRFFCPASPVFPWARITPTIGSGDSSAHLGCRRFKSDPVSSKIVRLPRYDAGVNVIETL
jgi:hypothetical protein